MLQKRLFITGGNGFIGSRVVRKLIEQGYSVRCLLRPTSRTDRIDDLAFERCAGDVRDLSSLRRGLSGCNGLIHLAGLSNWKEIHSPAMRQIVVTGTQNALQAAQSEGGLPVVFVSSLTTINGASQPCLLNEDSHFSLKDKKAFVYTYAKREAELLCQKAAWAGLPVVVVNPAEVYGPDDSGLVTAGNLVDFARSNPVFVSRGGTSVVHVDDVAAGIIAAFEKGRPGQRYILGGDNLTVKELATTTLSLLGQTKRIIVVPNRVLLGLAWLGRNWHLPLPFNPAVIPYAVRFWFADNSRARRELGLNFRSARETLEPTLRWLQNQGYIR
ncbi:MAG: hypothetical protein DPW09_18415 [Anaerolineae bacterium]|nr:hypothetical protein [Anaerolineae bacterium]